MIVPYLWLLICAMTKGAIANNFLFVNTIPPFSKILISLNTFRLFLVLVMK